MEPSEQRLCESQEISRLIASMAESVRDTRRTGVPLCLVGIRTRGVAVAERLALELRRLLGEDVKVGAVDITLYRDDLGRADRWPVLRGTEIPFDLEGADVVLVDDVLFTGRTVRAALNAICDLGRPACVRLAVLVDRGHRELPIRADVVGLNVTTHRRDHVRVRLLPIDDREEIVQVVSGRGSTEFQRSPAS